MGDGMKIEGNKMIQPIDCAIFARRCSDLCEPGCTYADISGSCSGMIMTLLSTVHKNEDEFVLTDHDLHAHTPTAVMPSIREDLAERYDQWQQETFPCTLLTLISVSATSKDSQPNHLSFRLISG